MKKAYVKASRYGKKFKYHKETEYDFVRLDVCGWYFAAEDENGREILGVWNDANEFAEKEGALFEELEEEHEKKGLGDPILVSYAYPTVNGELVEEAEPGHPYHIINPRELFYAEF